MIMRKIFNNKKFIIRREVRIKTLLVVLIMASIVVAVADIYLLVKPVRETGSWRAVWEHHWQNGRAITMILVSDLFHAFVLLLGWSYWLRFRRRELDQIRLRRSEQKYRNIINHAGEAIFLLDANGCILEWNKAAEKLFGVPRRDILNTPFREIHLCYGLEIEKAMEHALKHRRSLSFEFPFPSKPDHWGQISLIISLISSGDAGKDSQPVSYVVIARDITSEKQFESKMSETEKLAGIGQLAAGIAHQLNTPLGSIMLSAQMLEEDIKDEDAVDDVRRIIRQTEQCRTIIKGLLNFARPTGQERGKINLANAIRETFYLMEKNFKLADITVNIKDDAEFIVFGNRNELDQVFFNLLANSLDAMPDGGEIEIVIRDGDPGEVLVEFSDTGEGIPTGSQDKVFLPFFTTKEYGKGTGLGLSIVARIIHEHGGRIELDSERKTGTRFFITLPQPGYGLGNSRPQVALGG